MDVHYWITAEWKRQGFEFNFPRVESTLPRSATSGWTMRTNPVIERGDLLHVDFGVRSSGVVTDQQKMALRAEGRASSRRRPGWSRRSPIQSAPPSSLREIVAGPHRHEIKTRRRPHGKAAGLEAQRLLARAGLLGARRGRLDCIRLARALRRAPALQAARRRVVVARVPSTTAVPEWGGQRVACCARRTCWFIPTAGSSSCRDRRRSSGSSASACTAPCRRRSCS